MAIGCGRRASMCSQPPAAEQARCTSRFSENSCRLSLREADRSLRRPPRADAARRPPSTDGQNADGRQRKRGCRHPHRSLRRATTGQPTGRGSCQRQSGRTWAPGSAIPANVERPSRTPRATPDDVLRASARPVQEWWRLSSRSSSCPRAHARSGVPRNQYLSVSDSRQHALPVGGDDVRQRHRRSEVAGTHRHGVRAGPRHHIRLVRSYSGVVALIPSIARRRSHWLGR